MNVTKPQLDEFERLSQRFRAFHSELAKLDDADGDKAAEPATQIKVEMARELIGSASAFLGATAPQATKLPDSKVLHSDLSIVIGQFVACFDAFRAQCTEFKYGRYFWRVEDPTDGTLEYLAIAEAGG